MIKANYHTHTVRCHHASGTEREYIEQAIAEGFEILGFSDHTPQPYPDSFVSRVRMTMDELEGYIDTLLALREEYKDRIRLLIGFEVEYTLKYFEPLMKELRNYPVDYIIQGQHYVPDEVEGHYVGFKFDEEEKLKAYVDHTIEGMKTGLFTYLAHPDLANYIGDDDTYRKHMSRLVEAAVDLNIPLEINCYGFVDGRNYPCDRFFKMASEYHPRFVIGCDAHKPEMIRQPEHFEGLNEFLARNKITVGDNIATLHSIK
ncbi:MAG: histidinol-phosphatase [Lachnospiraceae bacterium]|nr:histidinol-phosphatase [Lachnospiraceae bacterium]